MRSQPVQQFTTVNIDQILLDGEFDEFESAALNADSMNGHHVDFEDSWDDEALVDLL